MDSTPPRRSIELRFAAVVTVDLAAPTEVGPVLTGSRRVIPIVGGRIEGPLLRATIVPGGADWLLATGDGTAVIDTRYQAVTDDGEHLLIATQGFRHGPQDVIERLAAGTEVDPGEYSFRLTARLESGAPRLAWVNRTIFVATAERRAAQVLFDLYCVA